MSLTRLEGRAVPRKLERDRRAAAELRVGRNPPPVGLHDRAGDREAQPAAAALARAAPLGAVEALEDGVQMLRGDARPAVADRDSQPPAAGFGQHVDAIL